MFQFCKKFLVIGNGECFKMFNLGTPGISRVAGGSVHRARDRSLPGNKILVTPVFHLGSYIAKMFPVAAATGGHKEIFQVAITHPLGSFTVHLQIFFWVGFRWDGHYGPEMGGMDPTCCHHKPQPTNPRDFLDTSLLLYRKGMTTNHDSVNFWDSGRKSETFISYLPASFGPPNKSSIQSFR